MSQPLIARYQLRRSERGSAMLRAMFFQFLRNLLLHRGEAVPVGSVLFHVRDEREDEEAPEHDAEDGGEEVFGGGRIGGLRRGGRRSDGDRDGSVDSVSPWWLNVISRDVSASSGILMVLEKLGGEIGKTPSVTVPPSSFLLPPSSSSYY